MKDSKRRFRLRESVTPKEWKAYVDMKKIVADSKVYPEGVKMYQDKIKRGRYWRDNAHKTSKRRLVRGP